MDNNQISVNTFDKLAQRYQDKYMDLAMYSDTFDSFISHLPTDDARVLELACGPGNITQMLLSEKPNLSILATDLAPNMLMLAKKNNPKIEVLQLDSRHLNRVEEQFDAIMCGFCLPYLDRLEAIALIDAAALRLKLGGILYLSTMEGECPNVREDTSSDGDKVFTYFHHAEQLVPALNRRGFKLLALQRKQQASPIGEVTDLFITARLDSE
jgi:2-polyprenyl-3-methyl-5-hydroxy-6-metoxy-1,4-benzoquinol methylase